MKIKTVKLWVLLLMVVLLTVVLVKTVLKFSVETHLDAEDNKVINVISQQVMGNILGLDFKSADVKIKDIQVEEEEYAWGCASTLYVIIEVNKDCTIARFKDYKDNYMLVSEDKSGNIVEFYSNKGMNVTKVFMETWYSKEAMQVKGAQQDVLVYAINTIDNKETQEFLIMTTVAAKLNIDKEKLIE